MKIGEYSMKDIERIIHYDQMGCFWKTWMTQYMNINQLTV